MIALRSSSIVAATLLLCSYNELLIHPTDAFSATTTKTSARSLLLQPRIQPSSPFATKLYMGTDTEPKTTANTVKNVSSGGGDDERLGQKFGGYTVKQRLREEVESPFRKVRFLFFLSSTGSALTALYFSALSALKASMGGYADAMPLDEALLNCGINLGGAVLCAFLAYRDYQGLFIFVNSYFFKDMTFSQIIPN